MTSLAYLNSPIGWIEISGDQDLIRAVSFVAAMGDESTNLPHTVIDCKKQLSEYFAGSRLDFSLPLAFSGTVFQNRVWQELCRIPLGKTSSYLQLAIKLGDAKCIRAAGTANGRNPIAIIIPCHRVIGNTGKLVGYAGGLDKKKWLLDFEAGLSGQQSLAL